MAKRADAGEFSGVVLLQLEDLTILGNQSGCALQLGWELHELIVGRR